MRRIIRKVERPRREGAPAVRGPVLITGICALLLVSCGGGGKGLAGRELWESKEIEDYRYTFNWSCFCPPDITRQVEITVRDGAVRSVVDPATGDTIVSAMMPYRTVDDLFHLIDSARDASADHIDVVYDSTYGYPTQATIDFVEEATDEELRFSAGSLVRE